MQTYNLTTYLIYIPITFYVIIVVGWKFYRHGAVYLRELFVEEPDLAATINLILLVGYYLLNLGYVALVLSYWEHVDSVKQMIDSLSAKVGVILVTLAGMHFFNLMVTSQLAKRKSTNSSEVKLKI